jgi:opacity protein-like surface antigen
LKSKIIFGTLLAIVLAPAAWAQSEASAFGPPQSLLVGAEFANLAAGFPHGSNTRLSGVGAMAEYNFNNHFGVEGRLRMLNIGGWNGQTQRDLLAGPRINILSYGKWRPYVSLTMGDVHIHYPFALGDGDQFAFAPGGGMDYRVNRRWYLRAAYEYQILPDSPNFTNATHYGMRPNGFSTGFLYRIK